MKIKLDENIPASLAAPLTELGHNADTAPQEGLAGDDDRAVWQGLGFSDIRRFRPGDRHGILLVRLRDPERLALAKPIREIFSKENIKDRQKGASLFLPT